MSDRNGGGTPAAVGGASLGGAGLAAMEIRREGDTELSALHAARRQVSGSNGRIGMWLAVAAETVFFVGLIFVTLSLRRNAISWPPPGSPALDLTLLGLGTSLLLASGGSMWLAVRAIRAGRRRRMAGWVGATLALGGVFVGCQWFQFQQMGGWQTGDGMFAVMFNILSGFHALHVGLGLALLAIVLLRTALGQFDGDRHVFVSAAAAWWAFVSAIWLPLLVAVAAA